MVAGRGYFVNNSSAAGIVKLPAGGTAGDTIAIKDYAGNFGTNNLTIQEMVIIFKVSLMIVLFKQIEQVSY